MVFVFLPEQFVDFFYSYSAIKSFGYACLYLSTEMHVQWLSHLTKTYLSSQRQWKNTCLHGASYMELHTQTIAE